MISPLQGRGHPLIIGCMGRIRHALIPTGWGTAVAVCTDVGLRAILWPQRSARLAERQAAAWPSDRVAPEQLPGELADRLAAYFAGSGPVDFSSVPLDLTGLPPFRAAVLRALTTVGYGRVTSYGRLAGKVGRPTAARAVGQAVGANPMPIVVPCHRVLRSDGELGGFSADEGLALKRRLLALEGIDPAVATLE